MDAIWKQLQTPEWWFTAVFVGLVIGVVGAYAKDFVSNFAASLSTTYAMRAKRLRVAEKRRMDLCIANPTILVIQYMRALFGLCLAFGVILWSMVSRAWDMLVIQYPEVDVIGALLQLPQPSSTVSVTMSLLLLILGFTFYWKSLRRLLECEEARSKLLRAGSG